MATPDLHGFIAAHCAAHAGNQSALVALMEAKATLPYPYPNPDPNPNALKGECGEL